MTLHKTYSCNLCHEKAEEDTPAKGHLFGLRFTNNHDFKIGEARTTDGTHVCWSCIKQIVEQMRQVVDDATA